MSELEDLKVLLENIDPNILIFTKHFYDRMKDRPIDEEMVRKNIKKPERLLFAEKRPAKTRGEQKYKAWFKLSNKYYLVLVLAFRKKDIYIITGWNTDRKWQKAVQK